MVGYTYKIINKRTGRGYVGSTTNVDKRWSEHKYYLKMNTHHNMNLQADYNNCCEADFEIQVTYSGPLYKEHEQMVLDHATEGTLYNIGRSAVGGDNFTNHPLKEEIKTRISDTMKRLHSLEGEEDPWRNVDFRGSYNPNWKGGIATDYNLIWDKCECGEDKKKTSSLCFNCHVSSRQGERNAFFGKSHSEETKEKLRRAHTGKENKSCWVGVSIEGKVFKNMVEVAKILPSFKRDCDT